MPTLKKADLVARNAALSREVDVLSLALSDSLAGVVKWFGNSRTYSLGIARPCGAAGGIVIVRSAGAGACAFYWETWQREAMQQISACITGTDTEHNRELMRRRACIESAAAYVRECQHVLPPQPSFV